jgi:purine-cytosine permease-like protein
LACQDLVLGSQCTIIYIWWLSQVNRWIVRPFFPPTMDIVTRCVARSCRMRWSFTTLVKKCSNWICLLPFTIQPMGSILTVDWLVSGNRSEQYSFPKFNWWL